MIFKSHATIAAHPDIALRARIDALDFAVSGEAGFGISTGEIDANVGEIPIHLTIPFIRRRRVVAGSIGPFRLTLRPIQAAVQTTGLRVEGVLGGEEGIGVTAHCEGKCRAEVEVTGQSPGKILKAAVEGVFEE